MAFGIAISASTASVLFFTVLFDLIFPPKLDISKLTLTDIGNQDFSGPQTYMQKMSIIYIVFGGLAVFLIISAFIQDFRKRNGILWNITSSDTDSEFLKYFYLR